MGVGVGGGYCVGDGWRVTHLKVKQEMIPIHYFLPALRTLWHRMLLYLEMGPQNIYFRIECLVV